MTDTSLPEVNASVALSTASPWRRLLSFVGPGFLVAVGYMDPGNWATDIAGGSRYGYALLSVILMSNLIAILLQSFCAKLGIAAGLDLAQASRRRWSRPVSVILWVLAEVAICATDLAELIGTAIALKLLFGLPLIWGVVLTSLDALLVLWLQHKGFRWIEALIIGLMLLIAVSFGINLALADPDWGAVLGGFIPRTDVVTDPGMLYIAMGIIGATVMPHNLYLHSAIVQTRAFTRDAVGKREAIRFATIDSTVALSFALFVNAAILILAAAAFHFSGRTDVETIEHAHELLAPVLGASVAPVLFALALLACGSNATVTATLAGQVVMEGFLNIRLPPWARRLITRLLALVPALFVTIAYGEQSTAELLVLSQVVLSLQLPFAVVPLLLSVGDRRLMGEFRPGRLLMGLGWLAAAILIALNIKLLWDVAVG